MAEKTNNLEREYTISLRRECNKGPYYERTQKAVKTIKKFIAKHMKVGDRDIKKVKLDVSFNNEVWYRGKQSPPSKVKVKAIKSEDSVFVTFVEVPEHIKFAKAKVEKRHKPSTSKPSEKVSDKSVQSEEVKSPENIKEEVEKEVSVAEEKQKEMKTDSKAEKHTTSVEKDKSSTKKRPITSNH